MIGNDLQWTRARAARERAGVLVAARVQADGVLAAAADLKAVVDGRPEGVRLAHFAFGFSFGFPGDGIDPRLQWRVTRFAYALKRQVGAHRGVGRGFERDAIFRRSGFDGAEQVRITNPEGELRGRFAAGLHGYKYTTVTPSTYIYTHAE